MSSAPGGAAFSPSPTRYSWSSTSAGFMYRDIWIWYLSPLTSRFRPSVSAVCWIAVASFSSCPQPAATTASSARTRARRRMRTRSLNAGDGRARPAVLVLLEDRLEAAQRLAQLALEPPALAAQGLHDAVGRERRLGLEHVLDLGAAARRHVERPDRRRADAV